LLNAVFRDIRNSRLNLIYERPLIIKEFRRSEPILQHKRHVASKTRRQRIRSLYISEISKSRQMYYRLRCPGCFGSIKNNYLTPRITISIDQQKLSLGIIEERLR